MDQNQHSDNRTIIAGPLSRPDPFKPNKEKLMTTTQDNGPMTLNAELASLREEFVKTMPEEIKKTVFDEARKLALSGIADRARKVGEKAPDFILPDVHGRGMKLSEKTATGPVVLIFYRGGWCPYCNIQLRALQRHMDTLRSLGASLVAISPQSPDNSLSTAEKHKLEFDVLSDVGGRVAREYGLVFELSEPLREIYLKWDLDLTKWNGDGSWDLPVPATYVLDRQGIIRTAQVDSDYTRRMEPSDILAALKELTR